MSDVPTRRGPFPADPAVTFRTDHVHTSERQDDGKVVELVHNASGHDYHIVGAAVPAPGEPHAFVRATAPQRVEELFYTPAPANHFLHVHHATRDDDDETPVEDMGERPDVASLMTDHQFAALAAVAQAARDSLTVAHAQENSLLELADAHAKEEGFTSGQRAGFAEGLHAAQQIVEEFKAKLSDDPYADDTRAVLDDVVVAFLERAVRES